MFRSDDGILVITAFQSFKKLAPVHLITITVNYSKLID